MGVGLVQSCRFATGGRPYRRFCRQRREGGRRAICNCAARPSTIFPCCKVGTQRRTSSPLPAPTTHTPGPRNCRAMFLGVSYCSVSTTAAPVGVMQIIDPQLEETHYWGECGAQPAGHRHLDRRGDRSRPRLRQRHDASGARALLCRGGGDGGACRFTCRQRACPPFLRASWLPVHRAPLVRRGRLLRLSPCTSRSAPRLTGHARLPARRSAAFRAEQSPTGGSPTIAAHLLPCGGSTTPNKGSEFCECRRRA